MLLIGGAIWYARGATVPSIVAALIGTQREEDIRNFLKGMLPAAKDAADGLLTGALGGLSFVAQVVSGALLAFVFLLYIVTGGDAIWRWIQGRSSPASHERVAVAGAAAWNAASGCIRISLSH